MSGAINLGSGWLTFSDLPQNYSTALQKFMLILEDILGSDKEYVYIDSKYNFQKATSKLVIKITDKELVPRLAENPRLSPYLFQKSGEKYITTLLVNVSFTPSGGDRGTGRLARRGQTQPIPTTKQQELGTVRYFESKFLGISPTTEEISNQVGFIFDAGWAHNFSAQYEAFRKNIGPIAAAKIHLDSNKNESDEIVNLAKKFGLNDLKDNWNPSDMWIMNISNELLLSETENITSLAEYNEYIFEKYSNKQIIGVSLKKIPTNRDAHFKVVSTKDMELVLLEPKRILFDPFQKNFIFETQGTVEGFNLRVGYKASTISKDSDIRVYLEGRQRGAKVQMGGVSSALFPILALANGFNIANDKKRIFANPISYMRNNIPEIMSHESVIDKMSDFPKSPVLIKAGAFLTYYLQILLESDPGLLNGSYYSSSKLNTFSSVHVKLH